MIDDIENNLIDCVIVKDLSRLGRDYIEVGKYLERYFPAKDVRFIAVNDTIDSLKSQYDMMMPIRNIFNEQYSRDISTKVKTAFKVKQKEGEFIGAFASFGYKKKPTDKHKLIIDPYAASIVKKIFTWYNEGVGKITIAKKLNAENILCPTEYKIQNGELYHNGNKNRKTSYWTYSSVNHILNNELYIGNMVQGKTFRKMKSTPKPLPKDKWVIVKNTHEPIIDLETWENTQNLLKRNRKEIDFENNKSIFAGFLRCGDCGRALSKTKWSNQNLYYSCATYKRYGLKYCTSHIIPHDVLEKIVLNDLNQILQNIDDIEKLINTLKKEFSRIKIKPKASQELQNIKYQFKKIQKLKKGLYEDYKLDILNKEEFLTYKKNYTQEEQLLNQKLAELEGKMDVDVNSIEENSWIQKLLKTKKIDDLDREIVISMIHMIYVYENNNIKIIYNFSNKFDHLFLKELSNE